jgi:quinone-modifying oxidoreductase subunit QmoC
VDAAQLVQPDTRFIHDLLSSGAGDLKKCMQCGTCSVVCSLSPEDAAFPRKQMLEAQWGLKSRLVGDPAIWLCHNCGDCSTRCPRGARPGDVFGALRQQAIQHFAFPRFLGRAAGSPLSLALVFLIPALLFWAIALWAPKPETASDPEFAAAFPIPTLETLFFALSGILLIVFLVGILRFLRALGESGAGGVTAAGILGALVEIATHERFSKCSQHQGRRVGHLLTLWGFVGLALTGTIVGIGTMLGVMSTPLALTSPWKILANLSAVVILTGCLILLAGRLRDPVQRAASTYFDWLFLLLLTAVALTGILSELLRLAQASGIMYGVYFVHLVLIFILFLYAPYSKFAHFAYRAVAMAVTRKAAYGDKVAERRQAAPAGAIQQ